MDNKKKFYISAFILYLTYFVHGIGCSILGQQVIKESLSASWGVDIARITVVSAYLGLGRLITLPFSGPISDKMGRRVSSLLGIISYAIFFVGLAFAPNMQVAIVAAIFGGIANSFLDTGVIPACLEILEPRSGLATMLTKFFISGAQLLLPFMLGAVAGANASYSVLFIIITVCLAAIGILTIFIPLPKANQDGEKAPSFLDNLKKAKFTPESVALILVGFTCTATFQLWLNCAQTFAKDVAGMADPSVMQSYYSTGTLCALVVTAILTTKVKPVRFLFVYPLVSLVAMVMVYVIATPTMCIVGSFLLGFFAAGGVLQLATSTVNDLFPSIKGTITSIIMIASSLSNYTILSVAGNMGNPKSVLIMNMGITVVGVILALFVNARYGKLVEETSK